MRPFFIEMMITRLDITKMNFKSTPKFRKDFKKLSKKFRSLESDLNDFKKVLNESPLGIGKHFNVINQADYIYIVKARFFCRSLKNKDLRIIYAYVERHQRIEMIGIEFIEVYFKGNKVNEDRKRIEGYLKGM